MDFESYLTVSSFYREPEVTIEAKELAAVEEVVGGQQVTLVIHKKAFNFIVLPGDTRLHLIDADGGLRKITRFKMKFPLEKAREFKQPISFKS